MSLRRSIRLPESDRVPLRIGKPGEGPHAGNWRRRNQRFSTEAFSLFEVCRQIIHLDVDGDIIVRLVAQRIDVPVDARADTGDAGIDHAGRPIGLHFPVEHLRIEICRLGGIATADLEMDDGIWHVDFPFDLTKVVFCDIKSHIGNIDLGLV